MAIRIGVYGYGNLGRGVECAVRQNPDMKLVAVFTRRNPASVRTVFSDTPVVAAEQVLEYKDRVDVMILCGGSATDLPVQTPALAADFHVVDSFDTHASIPAHFAAVDKAAGNSHVAVISVGWDPGLFSLNRAYAQAVLPQGEEYTFWGKGVSQGHSDAIRRIDGVVDARQYTIPVPEALAAVRRGETPTLTAREKHTRLCYVVAKEGADKARIEKEIVTMPHYFDQYDTTVEFISAEEMARDHSGIPHGGCVLRSGCTGEEGENRHVIEYSLNLDSNPEFTASVLVCYARAAYRLAQKGASGCHTVLDVPVGYLLPVEGDVLRRSLL